MVFISPKNEESLIQLPRTFEKPMGIAMDPDNDRIALACKGEVVQFKDSKELARHYPKSPNVYDALYLPRVIYKTSFLDIHDLEFGQDSLYAVNTLFSCIATIDESYNFTPYWKPSFISSIVSEDRCHLNGMIMKNGKPAYASCFNTGDSPKSWRENITKSGVIIDINSNEIISEGLAMPHSPRLINDKLYVLLSATGELVEIDQSTGKQKVVIDLKGFVRGMDYYKDFLFVGLSKIRKNSSTFSQLPISDIANHAGIAIIHLPTASLWGEIKYQASVDEIYDVKIVPEKIRPNILNTLSNESNLGIAIPDHTFWAQTISNQ